MMIIAAVLCGIILDFILGDPSWLTHPVVIMGKLIARLDVKLREKFPKTEQGERRAGICLALILPLVTIVVSGLICFITWKIHPVLGWAFQTLWCWQALAIKGLRTESMRVYHCLEPEDLEAARKAVGRIVGRDTQDLTAEGVTKATVETIAENFSDGVMAPLFYMIIGGAPLALCYKSINTMDSMVGYKNEKYIHFGRTAAKLDDVVNYIPARLAALFWILSAAVTRNYPKDAWRIWRRDNRNHASPNSAQTESACAGALGVQLAGPAWYFGEYYDKPTIGDPLRKIEPKDIIRTNRMMTTASILAAIICLLVRLLIVGAILHLL